MEVEETFGRFSSFSQQEDKFLQRYDQVHSQGDVGTGGQSGVWYHHTMVYLFIQMSSEMWDFDMYGDLYFEKAVNGFLYEMCSKWQKTGASHEVIIVFFSRTFYNARELSEFPQHMHEYLQQDYRGRFDEDFYRMVVQHEKFDDWFPTLTLLRQTLTDYGKLVVNYHHRPGLRIPAASNSQAAQGNFLEVINISLNTFEKHFINRNLDRTGQQDRKNYIQQ